MKNKKAVSLIVLVITIIVMIILSGAVIISLNGGGIFEKANQATLETEIASEKEALRAACAIAIGESKTRRVTVATMQKAMDKVYGTQKTTVINNGETIAIRFNEEGKYYEVSSSGTILGTIEVKLDDVPGKLTGAGTAEDPFIIMSIEDLVEFSYQVNEEKNSYDGKYVELGKTLDFKSDLSYGDVNEVKYDTYLNPEGDGQTGLKEQLTSGKGFIPIGKELSICFRGSFNGNNYAIQNIKIDVVGNAGLFGATQGSIKGGRKFSNLTLTGNISGTTNVAGLIGHLQPTGSYHMGTGWEFRTIIENIKNDCNIVNKGTGPYLNTAGIVGKIAQNQTTPFCIIKECQNYGNIQKTAAGHAGFGGIVGFLGGGTAYFINNCNVGTIKLADNSAYTGAGAMFGTNAPGTTPPQINIYNCYNLGKIEGKRCGGLLGQTGTASLNIYNSYNLVDMSNINAAIAWSTKGAILSDVFYASDSEKYINSTNGTIIANNVNKVTLSEIKTNAFIEELNTNIQNGYSYEQENEDGTTETVTIDTTGWAKWIVGEEGYPTLDNTTLWNGTEWVKQ